jgi:hypothetical protein
MSNRLDKNDPAVLYAKWQNITHAAENQFDEFIRWVEDEWNDSYLRDMGFTRLAETAIKLAVDKYLLRDKDSQKIIKKYEKEMKEKWTVN